MARNQQDQNDRLEQIGFDIVVRENSTIQTVNGAILDLVGSILVNGAPPGGGGGGVGDGDKGDIVVTDIGATWTIENGVVTLGKLANIATDRLLGRATAGTGTVELIVCTAAGRDLLDDVDITAQRATLGLSDGAQMSTATIEELIRDTIGTALVGSGMTVSPNDPGNQITISVSDSDKGDITVSATGTTWTIDNDAVGNAKLANVASATIKGRITASTGDPEDLTGTQVTTLLDVFTSVLKGLVPASGGGTTNFLRADGTWAAPPGGGGSGITVAEEGVSLDTDITTLDFGNGFDLTESPENEVNITLDLGEYTGNNLPNAKVAGLGSLALLSAVGSAQITDGSVTLADMANLAQDQVIGRVTASTGVPETFTVTAAARSVLDDTSTANMLTTLGAQPLDSDLTTIAGLTATTDNFIVAVSSAWASRTPAQVRTTLGLVIGTNVQAWDADLDTWATKTAPSGTVVGTSDTQTLTAKTLTDPKITQSINAQTGTTYTLVLTDASKFVTLSNAGAITLTVPPNSSVAFPVGSTVELIAIGAGQVTVAQGSGVTVNATPGLKLRAQYSGATLVKTGTDQWYLVGDLAA